MTSNKTITCRVCKKKVSNQAKRCPHCGTLLKMSTLGMIFVLFLVLFTVGIIVLAIIQ